MLTINHEVSQSKAFVSGFGVLIVYVGGCKAPLLLSHVHVQETKWLLL